MARLVAGPFATAAARAAERYARHLYRRFELVLAPSEDMAARHYAPHKGKPFYDSLVRFMTSSPVIVMALQGKGVIEISRKMMGATFGFKAEPGTIRGDFGVSSSFNLIHGSDSPESAKAELALWFKPEELHTYDLASRVWTYDFSKGTPE